MARKTALKQVLKMAPKSTQLAASMDLDGQAPTMTTAVQVNQGEAPTVEQPAEYVDAEVVDEQTGEMAFTASPATPPTGPDPWADQTQES
jgi:recombinational DNA repair protein RecT